MKYAESKHKASLSPSHRVLFNERSVQNSPTKIRSLRYN